MSRRAGGMRSRASSLPATLAIAALLAGACCAPARATPARLFALGGGDHLGDASEVFRWPGAARDDAGSWSLDSGRLFAPDSWAAPDARQDTGPSATVAWNPGGPAGRWTAGLAAHAFAADGDHAGLHRDGPGHSLAVLAGRSLGRVDVAATWRASFGDVPGDVGPADAYRHRRDEFGWGARVSLSPGAVLDVAGDARRGRDQAVGGLDALDPRGDEVLASHGWSARARAFVSLREHLVLAPVAEVVDEVADGSLDLDAWWADAPRTHHDLGLLRLGVALCWLPDPDRMFTASYERLDVDSRSLRIDPAADAIPRERDLAVDHLRVACERRLNWWLSLRASAGLAREPQAGPDDPDAYRADVAGGAALHLGAWGLDLAAGTARLPEPRRWLSAGDGTDYCMRATVQRTF